MSIEGIQFKLPTSHDVPRSYFFRFIHCFCGSNTKWILFRFLMIFVPSVIILCCIYGFKSSSTKKKIHSKPSDFGYSVGDRLFGNDLWLIIEHESDDRGLRTSLGKAVNEHVCAGVRAAQNVGWTPLVVGAKPSCCRLSTCRHLHPLDVKEMKLSSTSYFFKKYDFSSAMKVGAFLVAIKRGAVSIFHANPEVYYNAGVSPGDYQDQLEYQLKKLTLGVTFGLVKGKEPEEASIYNPYNHFAFSLNLNLENDTNIHRYKICEKDPPWLEKFLDNDGTSVDLSSPSLTLPGRVCSPFDSRNTAFARNAFWSLLVLPDIKDVRSPKDVNDKAVYVFRSIMAQTIFAATGGSTEFSISEIPTIKNVLDEIPSVDLLELATTLDSWNCPDLSASTCLKRLAKILLEKDVLSESNAEIIDLWINDLLSIGYEDIPVIDSSLEQFYPCLEGDALVGVYFQPSVSITKDGLNVFEKPTKDSLQSTNSHPGSPLHRENALNTVRRLCPSVDRQYLTTSLINKFNKHENLVLIITITDRQYHNLPIIELLYRHHFKNILYCGEPDPLVEEYRRHFSASQGIVFSFLPASRHPGYECLLGAFEMGYNVEGFLVADQHTLINSWNFKNLNLTTVWHGNEVVEIIDEKNLENSTITDSSISLSAFGIKKAFEFLEEALLKIGNVSYELFLHHPKGRFSKNNPRLARVRREVDHVVDDSNPESVVSTDEGSQNVDRENGTFIQDFVVQEGFDTTGNISVSEEAQPKFQVSLFGELQEHEENPVNGTSNSTGLPDQDISELLLDPANFQRVDENENPKSGPNLVLDSSKIPDGKKLFEDIEKTYNNLYEKLSLWLTLTTSGDPVNPEEYEILENIQCDIATNYEICKLVATFFVNLKNNEADGFKLYYDELPVYYVPSSFKETFFLMSNLFTRFDVINKMAFPILLRGLSNQSSWMELDFAPIPSGDSGSFIPEDLFLFDDAEEEPNVELQKTESAHYIYPVEIKSVLSNNALRNIICRNFGA